MAPLLALVCSCLLVAGCRREETASVDVASARTTGAPDGAFAVDAGADAAAQRLDAWLRYRSGAVTSLDAGLLQRARADDVALRASGLTDAEVDAVEDAIAALMTLRRLAQQKTDDVGKELERSLPSLTGDHRAQAEKTLSELRARGDKSGLEPLRARFGDAVIDALVAREAEVTAAWAAATKRQEPR